ncbi:hypothetical protein GO013_11270 [Pseudodesulfovibrio sp. JC047]|uniref:hypothetical protein n=1 Tax=Pseudodesulfovibrio sp. JC047 TaxID=2683199 RepID=UPI0013D7D7C5|nr:hypothetical protein [Pseudodesulfovibrio sp. JC047]NDV20002.1 hypothetical protein [Pseudodesulfovibrio sp. JC047]
MIFSAAYSDKFNRFGVLATYQGPQPSAPVPCLVRFQYGGLIETRHGEQEQSIIKVLWTDFPQRPSGIFVVNGEEWKVLDYAGYADGHREGLQRALLCGKTRKFSVEK